MSNCISSLSQATAREWLKNSAMYESSFSLSVALLKERKIIMTSQKYIKTNEQNPQTEYSTKSKHFWTNY